MRGVTPAGAVALALCLGVPGATAGTPETIPAQQAPGDAIKLADRDQAFLDKCDAAVQRGLVWLRTRAQSDGRFPTFHDEHAGHAPFRYGGTALAVLALLESKEPRQSELVEKGLDYLTNGWTAFVSGGRPPGPGAWKTYEAGLTLMALAAYDRSRPTGDHGSIPVGGLLNPARRTMAGELRDYLVANQTVAREVVEARVKGGGAQLVRKREAWHYPSNEDRITDHSNTQYAVLGLRAATALRFPAPKDTWLAVIDNFLATQEPTGPAVRRIVVKERPAPGRRGHSAPVTVTTGIVMDAARGWAYPGGQAPKPGVDQQAATGSMTTVGVACLAIALDELHRLALGDKQLGLAPDPTLRAPIARLAKGVEQAAWDGVAWLASNWSVTKNPGLGTWHYYYLYGLERAGMLRSLPTFGTHDWYREGGDLLCAAQRTDGSWDDQNGDHPVASTCFALLFLKRATRPAAVRTR